MKAPLISVPLLASASALALMLGLAAIPAQAVPVLAVDLTTAPTISGTINGVEFKYDKWGPTGTGVLNPFLRVTSHGNATDEQGYNTSASTLPFDDIAGVWTHDVLFSSMQAIGGFYNFVLDLGEPVGGTQELLSLDGVKLYAVSAGGQNSNSADGTTGDANGIVGTLLWDMDALADNYVLLNANRDGNPGNGTADMLMKVPTSVFAGVNTTTTPYFILWSRFGLQEGARAGSAAQGTFEEWALDNRGGSTSNGGPGASSNGNGVPEPGVLALLGAGLLGQAMLMRQRRRRVN